MLSKIILKQDLSALIETLLKDFHVIAPAKVKNVPTLDLLSNANELDLELLFKKRLAMIPPKKIFLPPNQSVFRYSLKEGITAPCTSSNSNKLETSIVIFGISPCDITGVSVLERIFHDYYNDDVFLKLYKKSVIIGVNCLEPCYENCFCATVNSNDPKGCFDIMLTELPANKLIAIPNSDKGKKLLRTYPNFFKNVTDKDFTDYARVLQLKNNNFKKTILVEGLASQIEDSFDSPLWEEYTKKCLFCGSCTFVCPTCYCYNIKDIVSNNLKTGERQREWDSCYFPEFALVAGDHNFRERKSQRFRYRYLHKFVDLPRRYNFEGCVGCGRCITYCPAKIDVRDVLKKVRGEVK